MRRVFTISATLVLLAGCSTTSVTPLTGDCDGVAVVVNYSGEATNLASCVSLSSNQVIAKEALLAAGVEVEGTTTYGDQVVCRVNGIPSATEPIEVEGNEPHLETCSDMPPSFAYWALWIKKSGENEWEYASEGISSLQLNRGDSVGLAFSLGGLAPNPEN